MPEAALPRLDAARRERLAALGIELLELRQALADSAAPASGADAAARVALSGAPWPGSDRLLQAVLAALGVSPTQIASGAAPAALRVVVGGNEGEEGTLALPPLPALRAAHTKRALWPQLRRWRRRLATDAPG